MTKQKYLLFRTRNLRDALWVMNHQASAVINSGMERRDPALRNLIEGMQQRGLEIEVDGCPLHVFLIEDNREPSYYQQFNEVEACFNADWFEEEKAKIRFLKGMAYHDATTGWSNQFPLKDQGRAIDYTPPYDSASAAQEYDFRLQ